MRARVLLVSIACGALFACSEPTTPVQPPGRPLDPPAEAGSTAPRLSVRGDRVALSWIAPAGASGPGLRYAVREGSGWSPERTVIADPLLAVDPANVPGVMPLPGGGWAAYWSTNTSPTAAHARKLSVATSSDGAQWSPPQSPHG